VGFVDIHSHILYGLDDGAKTAEESAAMLEYAAAAGTSDLVATPHANAQFSFDPDLIEARIAELSALVNTVRIHSGCDFHLQADSIQDAIAHPDKYTINHKCYLLVEFPDFSIFANSDEILSQLLDADLVPIVTHPERNVAIQRRLDELSRWIEIGCYVQVTAGSLVGVFGKRAQVCAEELVRRGLTHFVASDAHDCSHRPPSLAEAYQYLADQFDEAAIRPMFVDNPAAVLTGDRIDFEFEPRPVRRRRWYQFWR
jgi:protein-tyrosine phosphatase